MRVRTGPYVWMLRDPEVPFEHMTGDKANVFTFIGNSATAPVRKTLFQLDSARGLLEDTAAINHHVRWESTDEEKLEFRTRYDQAIQDSKFVLCPRGEACASIRFFEALRAGRVPVLISDDYVYPEGIDFEKFVVRVPEDGIQSIGSLLEKMEPEAIERSRLARSAYETLIEGAALLNYVIGCCLEIQGESLGKRRVREQLGIVHQTLHSPLLRNYQRRLRLMWKLS